jgi:mediator of RNA polymerase II transcription subunit 16, fungi type
MAWLADTLLSLPSTLPPTINLTNASTLSLPDLVAHLHSTNTVSLHLLLSSPTRGFLNAICRRLAHLDYIARKTIVHAIPGHPSNPATNPSNAPHGAGANTARPTPSISPELRAAYMKIATLTSAATLRTATFETLLSSVASHIKNAYSTHSPPLSGSSAAEKARNTMEIKMLFGGAIPDTFKSVIVELFREEGLLDAVRDEIEPARLFFADFAMLEVDDDVRSVRERRRRGMTMDCFRKTWLANPATGKKDGSPSGPSAAAVAARVNSGGANTNGTNGTTTGAGTPAATAVTATGAGAGGAGAGTAGPGPVRWRRCARCAAVMEDVLSNRQVLQWMVMQQRRCFCGGHWETIDAEKVGS